MDRAVSEIAKGQGKRSSKRSQLFVASLLVCTMPVWALPTGEQLMAGQASVSVPTANQMQIQQTSQNAVLNWQGFSIAQQESVNIQQPNVNAALLNRVV
jgi:large exoprotein involved in heme utilization and adhesion